MSVSFTLTASQLFPAGMTVTAYARSALGGGVPQPGQSPAGAVSSGSAEVSAHGVAVFQGLEPETAYFAAAQVGGVYLWAGFRTGPEAGAVSGSALKALGSVSGAVTLDASTASVFTAVVTGTTTFAVVNPPVNPKDLKLYVTQDAAGGRAWTVGGVTWLGPEQPSFQTGAGITYQVDLESLESGAKIYGNAAGQKTAEPAKQVTLVGEEISATHEEVNSAGVMTAVKFRAKETGYVTSITFSTGATANTATSLIVGIYADENITEEAGKSLAKGEPGIPLGEVKTAAGPGAEEKVKVTGLNVYVEAGIDYWLAFVPVGGTVHFRYTAVSGGTGYCESPSGGHTKLDRLELLKWLRKELGPVPFIGVGSTIAQPTYVPGWLGLNTNSAGAYLGAIDDFSKYGIVYDRSANLEWTAGQTNNSGLALSLGKGFKPVLTIEHSGYPGALPEGAAITTYVEGFLATVAAAKAAFPTATLLWEIINEPYLRSGATSAKYAAVVKPVLDACEANGIPLNTVYVAAKGNEWVKGMYAAQPALEAKAQAWYFHPYGGPNHAEYENTIGIQSVPACRAEMKAGQGNIIISEVGIFAPAVVTTGTTASSKTVSAIPSTAELQAGEKVTGTGIPANTSVTAILNGTEVTISNAATASASGVALTFGGESSGGTSASHGATRVQAAEWLREVLQHAARYHALGWLKACIVYSRNDGGWCMEREGSSLTKMGAALIQFTKE